MTIGLATGLGFLASAVALATYVPILPMASIIVISMGVGGVVGLLLAKHLKKKQMQRTAKSHADVRDSIEIERQKQLDEFRSKASNIPKVRK